MACRVDRHHAETVIGAAALRIGHAAVGGGLHAPVVDPRKFHLLRVTLRVHREPPVQSNNSLLHNKLYSSTGPMHLLPSRNPA